MKTLLLTNDDGFFSTGIRHLKEFLSKKYDSRYDIYVVAPDRERSGISMSITINQPLRLKQIGEKEYAVEGTPVDCINIALQKIMPQWPDFIISGMNEGENLCEDVFFSGTVAAAYTGHLYGVPSLAVSLIPDKKSGKFDFNTGARITGQVLETLLPLKNTAVVYNLNIPYRTTGKLTITSIGLKRYKPTIEERIDPRRRKYYWIGTGEPKSAGEPGTDLQAIADGNISLSVLKYDLNEFKEMNDLIEVFNDSESKN
ncbi:MAG: 5'/3'-nucleotidase SurE [Candidatus Aminicenantes bacterium]|nr:MAG: 5'/3'-nucleotidase SurE [Candidatus Aminicenantes bacterium]